MDETKSTAMMQELQQQVIIFSSRCASLAGELAIAQQRVQSLTKQVEEQVTELEDAKPKEEKTE